MGKKNKRLYIDMCAGSELMDTQGETLSVEGADISELRRLNDNHGKGFFNSLGMVTESKKIFKREDCENERHEYYWDKIKAPYIYAKGYLHNDEDHPNARAAAAILRNIHRDDCPLKVKASVEGGVISRGIKDPNRLARTKIHSVAITMTPANNATLIEPLNLDKSSSNWEADKQLIKSVIHLAETNVPSFRHIERHASANTIHDNIMKIQELAKSLGIDIEVKTSGPTEIMKQALMHKVANNVHKINKLVKALGVKANTKMMRPTAASAPAASAPIASSGKDSANINLNAKDVYQQEVGKLKTNPITQTKPKDTLDSSNNMKIKNAKLARQANMLKVHASKAMKNPEYLKSMHRDLTDRGVHPDKASNVIDKIKSHMAKSTDESDIEKGEIGRATKNLVIAGAMGLGAQSMGGKSIPKSSKQKISRSVASKPKEISPEEKKKKGREAAKWLTREALKNKLKKALIAGYGGAGAPTSMTGGSVIQSESLDDGRSDKGLDYIVCDNCGHEQIYMQHQVRCRECNKNFSLDKLQNHI